MSDAYEADVPVTRKASFWDRPEPDPFVCVSCDRTVEPNGWPFYAHRDEKPPFCMTCIRNFGRHLRPTRITRGDHAVLMRLKAAVERLKWEIMNGPTDRAFTPRRRL